jgi:hypothetical protein
MVADVRVGSLTAYLNPQLVVAILERVGWWGIHYRLRQAIHHACMNGCFSQDSKIIKIHYNL